MDFSSIQGFFALPAVQAALWLVAAFVVAAVIVLVAGLLVARLVRELLVPVFRKIKVDKLQEKAGVEVEDSSRLSETLAYVIYVLIVIPVVIVALQALDIRAISDPATGMLDTVINYIPYLAVGIVIIAIGVFIARLAGNIVGQLIATTGVDAKLDEAYDGRLGRANVSRAVNYTIQALVVIFFVVEGLNVLHLDVLTNIGSAIVGYVPNVLAAFIVFALAALAAGLAGKAIRKSTFASYAPLAQACIWAIAGFMVLVQLNIAGDLVQWAFIIILGALAVAFAVAFGVGGRDFAKKVLGYWGEDIDRAREAKVGGNAPREPEE